jgi:hypothetical protein
MPIPPVTRQVVQQPAYTEHRTMSRGSSSPAVHLTARMAEIPNAADKWAMRRGKEGAPM